jgi:hypothetical protein
LRALRPRASRLLLAPGLLALLRRAGLGRAVLRLCCSAGAPRASASAAPAPAACGLLQVAGQRLIRPRALIGAWRARRSRLLLLLLALWWPLLLFLVRLARTTALLLLLPLGLLLLLLAGTLAASVALPLRLAFLASALFLARLSRPLLVVAHLLVHEAAGLLLLAIARFVAPAIRATLPPFGIGALAASAED